MKQSMSWNRRRFVQWMGSSSLLCLMNSHAGRILFNKQRLTEDLSQAEFRFAYVSSMTQGILVFAIEGEGWRLIENIASEKPSSLALHPNRKFLFAANEIDTYQALPTGSVEAYGINSQNGRLTLINRQPLSLSATLPRHLAVSPNGDQLVVAMHGGGAYNVLPVNIDGRLGAISGILKETGSGPDREHQDAAHPQRVMFDTTGRHLLSTDLGNDRLSVFSLAEDRISPMQRTAARPGSGPHSIAIHPSGHFLYVANHLDTSLSCFGYDAARGKILELLHRKPLSNSDISGKPRASALAIHPSGNFLYTPCFRSGKTCPVDTCLAVWRIHPFNGEPEPIQTLELTNHARIVHLASEHRHLFFLSHREDGVFRCDVDPSTGRLHRMEHLARAASPTSFVMS